MRGRGDSTRRRLLVVAFATTSLVLLAVVGPLAFAVRRIAFDRAVRDAELRAQGLVPVLAVAADRATVERALVDSGVPSASIVLPDGSVVGPPVAGAPSLALALRGVPVNVRGPDRSVEIYTPVTDRNGGVAVIVVRVPRGELERGVPTAWLLLGVLGFGVLAVALVVNDRLARSIVAPLRALRGTTERLEAGELGARAEAEGPEEVAAAARTLNALAERIEVMLQAEREHVADLSHRLRTPLTALRLEAESLSDRGEAMRIGDGVQEVSLALDRLIREARDRTAADRSAGAVAETGLPFAGSDAALVVRDRMAFWAVLAADQRRPLEVSVPRGPVRVVLDQEELGAALDALVGNVFAHTPPQTPFSVVLGNDARGAAAVLIVEDAGPGVQDPTVLARGNSTAGSTGLGLDIVRKTLALCGGTVSVGPPAAGRGTRVELVLPKQVGRT